ncbi:HAMP domain-containing histidine kinase [Candidatus Woesebacteria bacterium]|nr:HAMP domain-containing histidine kinase [Candidatus Woesebacteria bacterium]
MNNLPARENILRILLRGTLILGVISLIINITYLVNSILQPDKKFHGDSPINVIAFVLLFTFLYVLLKKGAYKISAYLFVGIYVMVGFYSSIKWGADIPFSFLIYSLAIVVAGIIISGKSAIATNIIVIIGLITIIQLQTNNFIQYDYSWADRKIELIDGFSAGLILTVISSVSWLSNRQIESSFRAAKRSEKALKIERDNLELRVQQRGAELQKLQAEKVMQIYKFAEFGKLTAGLFHELLNPLTSISVNLEQLNGRNIDSIDKKKFKRVLKRVVDGTREMEEYVQAARKQIQQHEVSKRFSLVNSVGHSLKMFSYRIKTEQVEIEFFPEKDIIIYGNPIKIHHVLGNLIANALDAFSPQVKKPGKKILLSISENNKIVTISVSDNGKGIANRELKKVFDPFFTTKKEYGTGIGLSITKDIIEKSLNGNIYVKSRLKTGTTFTIVFPKKVS